MDKTTVAAEFVIKGDDFDPQIVTDRLNIIPTKFFRKNTNKKPKSFVTDGIPESFVRIKDPELKQIFKNINEQIKDQPVRTDSRPRWFSLWEISTGNEESFDINDQLLKIYNLLKDKVSVLNELRGEYNLSYTIEIIPKIEDNEKPALYLDNYIIDFAHEIKAIIDIDLYIYS